MYRLKKIDNIRMYLQCKIREIINSIEDMFKSKQNLNKVIAKINYIRANNNNNL